jgi:hypothetical protein
MGGIESKKSDLSKIPTYTKTWKTKPHTLFQPPTPPVATSIVTGVKTQNDEYGTYRPACSNCYGSACYAGECSAFTAWENCNGGPAGQLRDATGVLYTPEGSDYLSRTESCFCSAPPVCSRANIEECWLGNSSSSGEEPTYRVDWNGEKIIKCTFDLTKIDNVNQISKYIEKFKPAPSDAEYFKIMNKFCSQQRTTCPQDPTTGVNAPSCSIINATGNKPENMICRSWYDKLNPKAKDVFMDSYCLNNPTSAECKCVLRGNNPIYTTIKKYFSSAPEQDGCLWTPCKGITPLFFVPSRDVNPPCPSTFCQQQFNVSDVKGNVTIRDNQTYVQCAPPPIEGAKGQQIVNPFQAYKPPETQQIHTVVDNSQQRRHQLGFMLIVMILIILFVAVYFSF